MSKKIAVALMIPVVAACFLSYRLGAAPAAVARQGPICSHCGRTESRSL